MANNFFQRTEIKYLLSDEKYRAFLERIRGMLSVDEYGETTILNIYFDTPDFRLIRASLEKPEYKEKLRLRTYGTPCEDSTAFVEIKKKYAGVVYKRRTEASYGKALRLLSRGISPVIGTQIGEEIGYFCMKYEKLSPAMAISYDRIAMRGTKDPELRVTFDRNIRQRTDRLDLRYGNVGRDIISPTEHLMEIKIAGAMPLELSHTLSELEIYPTSFSKYGRGYLQMLSEEKNVSMRRKYKTFVVPDELSGFASDVETMIPRGANKRLVAPAC